MQQHWFFDPDFFKKKGCSHLLLQHHGAARGESAKSVLEPDCGDRERKCYWFCTGVSARFKEKFVVVGRGKGTSLSVCQWLPGPNTAEMQRAKLAPFCPACPPAPALGVTRVNPHGTLGNTGPGPTTPCTPASSQRQLLGRLRSNQQPRSEVLASLFPALGVILSPRIKRSSRTPNKYVCRAVIYL